MVGSTEMARVLVITDLNGDVLATFEADPVDAGGGVTIQAVPVARPDQRHRYLNIPGHLAGRPGTARELHSEVRRQLDSARDT